MNESCMYSEMKDQFPGEWVLVTTGSSVEFAPRIWVELVEGLGRSRRGFPMLCHTLPPSATVDGLLGLDFLRGNRLVVDFPAGIVEPQ